MYVSLCDYKEMHINYVLLFVCFRSACINDVFLRLLWVWFWHFVPREDQVSRAGFLPAYDVGALALQRGIRPTSWSQGSPSREADIYPTNWALTSWGPGNDHIPQQLERIFIFPTAFAWDMLHLRNLT